MSNELHDQEQIQYFGLLYLLIQSGEQEWDKMRGLACDDTYKEKIYEYFSKVFGGHYNDEIIPINSCFFRSRQIKKTDASHLGVNKTKLKN